MLDAGVAAAFADGLVEGVGGGGRAEEVAPGFAEAGDAGGVERDFGDGAEDEFLQLGGAALGAGVEAAEGFQGVAEQVQAHGVRLACGVDV